MTDRPYQPIAAAWLAARKRGIVCAAAGSGKTHIAALALDMAIRMRSMMRRVKVGILVNTKEQAVQMAEAIGRFPAVMSQKVKIACAAAKTDWSDTDVLVCDEVHHAATAQGWQAQIERCNGRRWGFTATIPEAPEQKAVLTALFGEVHQVERATVQAHLAPAIVQWLDATDANLETAITAAIEKEVARRTRWWRGDPGELWGMVAHQTCTQKGIIENAARTEAAIAAATNPDSTIVITATIEHAKAMAGRIGGAVAVYAAMGAKKRTAALDAFKVGNLRCVVSVKLIEEGFDAKIARVLVRVAGGRSARISEQTTGRVLRVFEGKPDGRIFDFTDDQIHPLMRKHARLRGELYARLGYQQRNPTPTP